MDVPNNNRRRQWLTSDELKFITKLPRATVPKYHAYMLARQDWGQIDKEKAFEAIKKRMDA